MVNGLMTRSLAINSSQWDNLLPLHEMSMCFNSEQVAIDGSLVGAGEVVCCVCGRSYMARCGNCAGLVWDTTCIHTLHIYVTVTMLAT